MAKKTTTQKGLGRQWQALCEKARKVYPPTCHVCMGPIDLNLPARHRLSWSLDHLDPRSKYGVRCPPLERTRPAHLACNSRKSNKVEVPGRWVL